MWVGCSNPDDLTSSLLYLSYNSTYLAKPVLPFEVLILFKMTRLNVASALLSTLLNSLLSRNIQQSISFQAMTQEYHITWT